MCGDCGKRVFAGRSGSFTQWIFRQDLCSCAEPRIIMGRQTDSGPQVSKQPVEYVEEDEEELPVDPREFPIDRYKPIAVLGEGVSGRVYLSRDRVLGKRVAVKTLRQLTQTELIQFQTSAKANSKLTHPNIVQVLDFGASTHGLPFMVMDFVKGHGLDQIRQQRGYLNWQTVLTIMVDLCDALEYAHDAGIFHRDLKPSNILVDNIESSHPYVCLIDFGVAQISGSTETSGNSIVGTPAYMSPDTSTGLTYSARSDLYSLGCVMFECIAGRPPFISDTALETLRMHADVTPPMMADLNRSVDIPDEVQKIVSKCLEKRPSSRFHSATELKIALKRALRQSERQQVSDTARVRDPYAENNAPYAVAIKKPVPMVLFISAFTVLSVFALFLVVGTNMLKPPEKPESPKKEKELTTTELTRRGGPKSFEELFEQDADVKYKFTARMDLIDSDLEQLLGRPVQALYLGEQPDITDSGCKIIARLPLVHLLMRANRVTDRGVKRLASIPTLRGVGLGGPKLTDVSIEAFSPEIETLGVPGSNITDKCMGHVAMMQNLVLLNVSETDVTDEGFCQLTNLPLRELWVGHTKITDRSLRALANGRARLRTLSVINTNISEDGLRAIRRMPLRCLEAGMCEQFDDRCLALVQKQFGRQLNVLSIDDTAVTKEGLKVLPGFWKLHVLRISRLELKDEDLEPVLEIPTLASLDISRTFVTDKIFAHLATMPNLRRIICNDCPNLSVEALRHAQGRFKIESNKMIGLAEEPDFGKFLGLDE